MRHWHAGWFDRLIPLIDEARDFCGSPRSASDIVKWMTHGGLLRKIDGDKEMKVGLLAEGLNKAVRDYLKMPTAAEDATDDAVTEAQLSLWPSTDRKVVVDIGRAAVFVPSRSEFLPLDPSTISRAEAFEAGHYLIRLAQDTKRRGELILLLAERSTAWP